MARWLVLLCLVLGSVLVAADVGQRSRPTLPTPTCFRRDLTAMPLERHRVKAGDTWTALGRRYRISVDLLRAMNPGRSLRSGGTVRVLDCAAQPIRLEVHRRSFRLLVRRGDVLLGSLPIGIGTADHPTPLGRTTVAVCARNPDWRDPVSRRVFRSGDPRNVLGGYWLGLVASDVRFRGIGIHGYTAETPDRWLERPGSRGCIRLRQEDIAWLFSLIRPGVQVAIGD